MWVPIYHSAQKHDSFRGREQVCSVTDIVCPNKCFHVQPSRSDGSCLINIWTEILNGGGFKETATIGLLE